MTRQVIAHKLKKDAQDLQDGDIERLIRVYVDKITAYRNEVVITVGVNIAGCGGGI